MRRGTPLSILLPLALYASGRRESEIFVCLRAPTILNLAHKLGPAPPELAEQVSELDALRYRAAVGTDVCLSGPEVVRMAGGFFGGGFHEGLALLREPPDLLIQSYPLTCSLDEAEASHEAQPQLMVQASKGVA